jgi:O-antigen ligase
MNSKSSVNNTVARYLSYTIATVLVLLPFHAVFTTWLGSNFGHLDAWRIWKELVIVAMLPFALYLCWVTPSLRQWFKRDWLLRLCLAYAVWLVGLGFWAIYRHRVNGPALIYGLLSDLRFLGFMLIIMPVAALYDFLRRRWLQLLVGPAVIVIIFGLLQRYVLSYDFLRHVGYGPKTIPAYQTVDQKIEYRRIQSTLRGANPLGAYLMVVLTAVVSRWRNKRVHTLVIGILLAGTITLFFTYSRAAWLALIISAALVLWAQYPNMLSRRRLAAATVVVLLLGSGGLLLTRHNRTLQNTFFHTDNTSASPQSTNATHLSALKIATIQFIDEPFGRGPGTAGPASFRNNHPPRIAESYFLQIGQEAGWIGLFLFVAINVLIVWRLWQRRVGLLPQVLLATWLGLTLINLVSHAWADDTLGLLFFGLAGIALAPVTIDKKRKHNGQVKKA